MVLILLRASRKDAITKMPLYQPKLYIWVLLITIFLMLGTMIYPLDDRVILGTSQVICYGLNTIVNIMKYF